MTTLATDYLVVGAGLAGMAFTDSLIADSDADVLLADRRHQPGGHWNDAYPFCRLHMPSANYGVNSRDLGRNTIDDAGLNAGLYARATGPEVCAYFHEILEEHLLPSGQVRFRGMSSYVTDGSDEHQIVSLLSGRTTTVRVRRKVVDATYLESSVPSRHRPSYEVDPDVRLVTPNDLVRLPHAARGYTVIGAGKTAMDTCQWLLDNGVAPDTIRWVRPRDGWFLNRRYYQPLDQVATFIEGQARQVEAAALAEAVRDLFDRLEATEQLLRLDPTVEPTMFHAASATVAEQESLQQIENVVRMGKVLHLGARRITLEKGTLPTDAGQVHVDCTAPGPALRPARTIFEDGRITLQQVRQSQPSINAAILGHIEATRDGNEEKNRLSPRQPVPRHGPRLDPLDAPRPASGDGVGHRPGRGRLAGPLAPQHSPRAGAPRPHRPTGEVGADPLDGAPPGRPHQPRPPPTRRRPLSADRRPDGSRLLTPCRHRRRTEPPVAAGPRRATRSVVRVGGRRRVREPGWAQHREHTQDDEHDAEGATIRRPWAPTFSYSMIRANGAIQPGWRSPR